MTAWLRKHSLIQVCKTTCSVTVLLLPNRCKSLIAISRHPDAIDFSRQTFHFDHYDPRLAAQFLGLLLLRGLQLVFKWQSGNSGHIDSLLVEREIELHLRKWSTQTGSHLWRIECLVATYPFNASPKCISLSNCVTKLEANLKQVPFLSFSKNGSLISHLPLGKPFCTANPCFITRKTGGRGESTMTPWD